MPSFIRGQGVLEMKAREVAVEKREVLTVRLSWLAAVSGYFIAYRLSLSLIDLLR